MTARSWARRLCFFALLVTLAVPSQAFAQSGETAISEQMEQILGELDLSAWEDALTGIPGAESARDIAIKLARGEAALSAEGILRLLLSAFLREAAASAPVALRIIALALLAGVLRQMRGAFSQEGVARVAQMACLLLCVVPLAGDFGKLVAAGRQAIDSMTAFTERGMPVMLTLLAVMGAGATAAVAQPAVLAATGVVTTVVGNVVLPLIMLSAALTVAGALSTGLSLDRLRSLIRTACHFLLGVSFTVFAAVLAIQGVAAAGFDGISLRTAKYAVDNFVPIVGGLFADSVDVFIGCSMLVKNGLGLSGLIAVLGFCITPVIRILATIACYKAAGAILQPMADEALVNCLGELSSVLTTLLVAVLSAAAMFLVLFASTTAMANITTMIR